MNCPELREHIPVYADGELADELRGPVEAHLGRCPRCRGAVERWRALRRCAQRATQRPDLPAGLETQIVARLARARGLAIRRRGGLGAGLVATAALLLIGVMIWKFGVGSRGRRAGDLLYAGMDVAPARFVEYYRHCAGGHCDGYHVHALPADQARGRIPPLVEFPVALPDLSPSGYFLDGACACLRLRDVRTVHAHYRMAPDDAHPVSFFSLADRVRLEKADDAPSGKRRYQEASADGVVLLLWQEDRGCFVACAELPRARLIELVESLDASAVVSGSCESPAGTP